MERNIEKRFKLPSQGGYTDGSFTKTLAASALRSRHSIALNRTVVAKKAVPEAQKRYLRNKDEVVYAKPVLSSNTETFSRIEGNSSLYRKKTA